MYLIVGLGNPESDYSRTRHNMGFDVINKLSEEFGIEVKKQKFNSMYGTGIIKDVNGQSHKVEVPYKQEVLKAF